MFKTNYVESISDNWKVVEMVDGYVNSSGMRDDVETVHISACNFSETCASLNEASWISCDMSS